MDFTKVNWVYVAAPVIATVIGIFLFHASKRQWTKASLAIGIAHLPLALFNAAAPFRGTLDPNYVGYELGMVHASKGLEVFVFSSFLLIGATACAVIAVQNRNGLRNGLITMFDAMVVILFVTPLIGSFLKGDFNDTRIELGEYLQIGGTTSFLILLTLIAIPSVAGLIWSWRKVRKVGAL